METRLTEHIPVMPNEIIQALTEPIEYSIANQSSARHFDGTFGRGGHVRLLLEKFPNLQVLGFDQDQQAIDEAQVRFESELASGKVQIVRRNFKDFDVETDGAFDSMLLDLGVSSPQLDQADRGFSFYHDGPLDMRMDQSLETTAADIINNYSEDELNQLFKDLGEVFKPYRVVRAAVHDRKEKPYLTTREFASLIERVEGWRKKGFHPATQYFMALRLEVNQELTILAGALRKLVLGLKPKGRLAVLTFHSLEDRIVKNTFKELLDQGRLYNKKVIVPNRDEEVLNPRARSAKLRVFEKE